MELHKVVHKSFLLSMFVICLIAVAMWARTQVEASDVASNLNSLAYLTNINVDAVATDMKAAPKEAVSQPVATSTPAPALTSATTTTAQTPTNDVASSNVDTTKTNTDTTAINTETIKPAQTQTSKTTTSTTLNTQNAPSLSVTKMVEVSVEPVNRPAVDNVTVNDVSNNSPLSSDESPTEKVIPEPVIVKAADLSAEKNPKVSGGISQQLSIGNVQLVKKTDGQKSLLLSGKAVPSAMVKVYIFSQDPVVITVKADENGDWSYELSKELADGQHEAYVAITDDAGRIISKAEPIAFIKTAEAATVIPFSELKNNESPMQRSAASYVLIAIAIMSVCLVIALVLIGILTHKHNNDAPIA